MQDNSDLIIRDCCEAEVAQFGKPDTICITVDVLREIVQRHFPGTCLHQIQEPAGAPAAVAVADELIRAAKQALACMNGLQQHLGRAVCQVEADALRAALAATPAAAPGKLGDDMQIRCRKCGEQATVEFNSARIVTHNPHTGKPRDARDMASDPEGKLIVAPGSLPAATPAEGGREK